MGRKRNVLHREALTGHAVRDTALRAAHADAEPAEPFSSTRAAFITWGDRAERAKAAAADAVHTQLGLPGWVAGVVGIHHVIPSARLRDLDRACAPRPHHREVFRRFLARRASVIDDAGDGRADNLDSLEYRRFVQDPDPTNTQGRNAVSVVLESLPANLFLGPHIDVRDDDPRTGFESGCRSIVGEDRFELLERAATGIQTYVARPDDLALLSTVVKALEDACRNRAVPYGYRPEQWRLVEVARYEKAGLTLTQKLVIRAPGG